MGGSELAGGNIPHPSTLWHLGAASTSMGYQLKDSPEASAYAAPTGPQVHFDGPFATWQSHGQGQLLMGRTSPELHTSVAAWTEVPVRKRGAGEDICVETSLANIWWFVEN